MKEILRFKTKKQVKEKHGVILEKAKYKWQNDK